MIASTVDADLLDYLRRDAYFTGLAHDYDDRVFRYFTVADDHLALSMVKHGMDRPDARSEVIQLLRMRYFLTERVYYHHQGRRRGDGLEGGRAGARRRRPRRGRSAPAQRLDAARSPGARRTRRRGAGRAPGAARPAQARLRGVGLLGRRDGAPRWCAASTRRAPSATPPSARSPPASVAPRAR
ncbi:MAG: hypothetical protein U0802_13660 [Candidatus Binatia bacterium]